MYTFKIVPEKKLVIIEFNGKVDFQEITKANTEITTDSKFKPSFNGVVDHRKSDCQLSAEEVKAIADSVSNSNSTIGRWVIIVDNPENTAFSLLYAQNIKQQHPQNICSTVKGASDYLGIDLSEYLEPDSFD